MSKNKSIIQDAARICQLDQTLASQSVLHSVTFLGDATFDSAHMGMNPHWLTSFARRFANCEVAAESTELALVLPLFLLVVFVSMQFALIGMVRYEIKYITRETTRWLAVNPDTTDAALLTRVQSQIMPGMASGNIVSLVATPSCAALSAGHCSGRSSGSVVTVALIYDPSSVQFLQANFFGFSLTPSRLSSQVSILVE